MKLALLIFILQKLFFVKRTFLLLIVIFYCVNCFAQDTIELKSKFTDLVTEHFHELKNKPGVKQGAYNAFYRRKTLIASGFYKNDKKLGSWHFYNRTGRLVEKFNYNKGNFIFEAPLDDESDLSFVFDDTLEKTDTVTRPLKIGGSYYGFLPYLSIFQLPFETRDLNTEEFTVYVELLVSPGGRLADYKVHVLSNYYDYNQVFNLDINLFADEDRTFIPAALNHSPVLSRVFIHCAVNSNSGIDFF